MRSVFTVLAITAALMCGASFAQTATQSQTEPNSPKEQPRAAQASQPTPAVNPQAQPPNQAHIAPGSVIPVQLTKTVDAKKAKTGDEVVAKVTQDMKTNQGAVLVPKDTKVIGHVTEAQARHKDEKESQLGIAFNQAVLNNQQVQLPMSIQAVIGQEQNNMNNNAAPAGEGAPSSSAPAQNSPMANRSPMGSSNQSQSEQAPNGPGNSDAQQPQAGNKMPPINGKTQGVIGLSSVNLAPTSNSTQGSLLTSDKKNVKLESGTMLLLRVNP